MTIHTPLYMQKADDLDPDIEYPAAYFRQLIAAMFSEGVLDGMVAAERAAGATFDIEVSAGVCVVDGDDSTGQGAYLAWSDATETVTVPAAPGSNSRYDLLVFRVNDEQAGGDVDDPGEFEVIEGTASGSPVAPDAPDTATPIAVIGPITPSTTSITADLIVDARVMATLRHDVIVAESIITAKLADLAVTTAKLADLSVTTAKLAAANVTEAKLATAVLSSAWTEVTYASGWANGGADGLIYKKVGNIVYVQGLVSRSGSTTGSTTTIATLPAGFRPAATQNDFTNYYVGSGGKVLSVSTGGAIQIAGATNGDLYGIRLFFEAA